MTIEDLETGRTAPARRLESTRRAALAALGAGGAVVVCAATALAAPSTAGKSAAAGAPNHVRHRTIDVDGVQIFYREAGREDAPALLLLHGFPSSSHMFRHLIPALADRYRVIAPDYPGFGFSEFPPATRYAYSFAGFARTMAAFTDLVGLRRYALYIQDYGAPVGLRLALLRPAAITGLIVQNGNAYEEGLSEGWDPLKAYWKTPTSENRQKLRAWLTEDGTRLQYAAGLSDQLIERLSPETWTLDWLLLNRPGNIDMQLDLFGDYEGNVKLYPAFQEFFRERKPPTLLVWGRRDPFFTEAGARSYLRDLPAAELNFIDAGHFVLETHANEAIMLIRDFLQRRLSRPAG